VDSSDECVQHDFGYDSQSATGQECNTLVVIPDIVSDNNGDVGTCEAVDMRGSASATSASLGSHQPPPDKQLVVVINPESNEGNDSHGKHHDGDTHQDNDKDPFASA
jgi:hypothetical protein